MAGEQIAPIETVSGEFGPKAFADLLRRLADVRTVAYVIVSDGRSEKCLFFPVGGLRLASAGARRVRGLADVVLAHPDLPAPVAQKLRQLIAQRGASRFPTAKREAGEPRPDPKASESRTGDEPEAAKDELEALLGAPDVRPIYHACCKQVIRDELLDLVVWDGASYEYRESNPPPKLFAPEVEAVKLSLGVKDLLEEVQGQLAEWTKLQAKLGVPSKSVVRRGPSAGKRLGPQDVAVAAVMGDKGCTVDEAILAVRRTGKDAISAAGALAAMADQGLVTVDVRPPAPSAEVRRKRALGEIDQIEGALAQMIQQLMARRRLAASYREVGDVPRAVENLRIVGDELMAQGRHDEAIDSFREIVGLAPDAFDARERIAAIYERLRRMPEAVKEWLALARQLARLNLWNRAIASLRKATGLAPEDVDNRRRLVDLLTAQGQPDAAAKELEVLARSHQQAGREQEALACWQQLLALKPDHEVAAQRVRATVRRGVRWFLPVVSLGLGAVLLLGCVIAVGYRHQAILAYRAARDLALEHAGQSRWAHARAALDAFDAAWGFDPPRVVAVRAALEHLREDEGESLLTRAKAHEEAGRVPEAREGYRLLERLQGAATAGGATSWGERATTQLVAIQLREDEAKQKAAQAAQHLTDGKLVLAFDLARRVATGFPWTPEAAAVEVPLEVRTIPAGAAVTVDGAALAQPTPCVVTRAPRPYVLRVTRDGWKPIERRIDPLAPELVTPLVLQLERAARWRIETLAPLAEPPALVSDGGLVVAGADQRVYGVTGDGQVRWTRTLSPFAAPAGPPLMAASGVVIAEEGGAITGVDPRTGATRWSRRATAGLRAVGVVDGAAVLVAPARAFALDPATGDERWQVALPAPATLAPALGGRRLFVPTAGPILVVDLEKHALEGRLETDGRPSAPPAADARGRCVVATEDGFVALLARGGWRRSLGAPAHAAPVVTEHLVLVPVGDRLVALSLEDGEPRWERRFPAPVSSPGAHGARAWVVAQDGAIHGLGLEKGDLRWSLSTGGRGADRLAPPVESRGVVYVAGPDGGIHAIAD